MDISQWMTSMIDKWKSLTKQKSKKYTCTMNTALIADLGETEGGRRCGVTRAVLLRVLIVVHKWDHLFLGGVNVLQNIDSVDKLIKNYPS